MNLLGHVTISLLARDTVQPPLHSPPNILLCVHVCVLILSGVGGVVYTSNQDPSGPLVMGPGVSGLSNATLDEPWQKVERGKEMFSEIIKSPDSNLTDRLLKLLSDDTM